LDPEASKKDQFLILRQIKGLNSATARPVVTLLQADESGSRTCVHNLVHQLNIGHGSESLAVASLPRLLQEKCSHSHFFRQMLQEIVKKYGSELRLVLAWDEAVPGNILQPDSFFADQVS